MSLSILSSSTIKIKLVFDCLLCPCAVIREIFVSYSSKSTKINHRKYFLSTYYVIERLLIYRKVRKNFYRELLLTNISLTRNFP